MARKAGQGKEEEESRARQQEEKTPVRDEEKTPARHGGGHHVVEQGDAKLWFKLPRLCRTNSKLYGTLWTHSGSVLRPMSIPQSAHINHSLDCDTERDFIDDYIKPVDSEILWEVVVPLTGPVFRQKRDSSSSPSPFLLLTIGNVCHGSDPYHNLTLLEKNRKDSIEIWGNLLTR
ncbi:hypothetical protein STEG23_038305 [Scotinomys teguina]